MYKGGNVFYVENAAGQGYQVVASSLEEAIEMVAQQELVQAKVALAILLFAGIIVTGSMIAVAIDEARERRARNRKENR